MGSDPRKRMACGWRRIVGAMLWGSLMPIITVGCAYDDRNPHPDPFFGGPPAGVNPGTSTASGGSLGTPAVGTLGTPAPTLGVIPPITSPQNPPGTVMLTNRTPPIRDASPDLRIPTPPTVPGPSMPTTGGVVVATPTPLIPGATGAGALGSPSPYSPAPPTAAVMASGPPPSPSFEDVRGKLTSLGMLDYQLQGNAQVGYSFIGHFLDPLHTDVMKTRESKGPSEVAAMQAVVDDIGRSR